MSDYGVVRRVSPEGRERYLQKVARTVTEVQPNVSSVGDVLVFLEVLGYTDNMAAQNGFENLYDLAKNTYEFIDHYADKTLASSAIRVPSKRRRTLEALSLSFPWVGSWSFLLVFGVSLWLSRTLPLEVSTSFLLGVMVGLIASQGHFQAFHRHFAFYYVQGNSSETKRVLERSYLFLCGLLMLALTALSIVLWSTGVPLDLIILTDLSALMLSFHLASYIPIFTLKKLKALVASYLAGFAILLLTYFITADLVFDLTSRFLLSMGLGFAVLSIAPLYYHSHLFILGSMQQTHVEAPHFYSPVFTSRYTINSRFNVQLWEGLPFIFFGTFYMAFLFGDRILSWIFNPIRSPGGTTLPLVFNAQYHIGADLALLVLFPAMLIQYVMTSAIFEEIYNYSMKLKVTEAAKIDQFLKHRYTMVLLYSILASTLAAVLLLSFGPMVVAYSRGSNTSTLILSVATISNLFSLVFAVNAQFMLFLNRVRPLVFISMIGALSVWILGGFLGGLGFENVVYAYLVACVAVAVLSSLSIRSLIGKAASLHYSRFT